MSKIALTKNEFNLILKKESHPVYIAEDDYEIIEEQSGCDILRRYNVINNETKEVHIIEVVYNSSYGDFQDEPQDGDFYIDPNKEDIYNSLGELLREKEPEPELTPLDVMLNTYNDMKEKGVLKETDLNGLLALLSEKEIENIYGTIYDLTVTNKNSATWSDVTSFQHEIIYPIAVKYSLNVDYLWQNTWHDAINYKEKAKSSFLKHYLLNKEMVNYGGLMVQIDGREVFIKNKDLEMIRSLPL